MKKTFSFFLVILFVIVFSGCNNKNKLISPSASEWDLRLIGYYDNWDGKLAEGGYEIGIIDINSVAVSDDKLTEILHTELLISIVERISNICVANVITLPENVTNEEFLDALDKMINDGIKVINVSLGTAREIQFNEETKDKIKNDEVLIVCSAGNDSVELMYPALCDETISVLPCDINKKTNKKTENFKKISYMMPGLHINVKGNYFSGSSLSAVYFSVICAAYTSLYPDYDYQKIERKFQNSCIYPDEKSYGVVQINKLF